MRGTRRLGRGGGAGVALDTIVIDDKYRGVIILPLLVLGHHKMSTVQDEPIPIEPCRHNGVVLFPRVVPQDDDPKVIRGNAGLLKGNKFGDRVIFAVSGTFGERDERRGPDILRTLKCPVAHWPYF